MESLAKIYTGELLREEKYLANWLPNNPIKLGDIGDFQDNCFIVKANIADYNVAFEKIEGTARGDINYSSSGGVTISTKASGSLLPNAPFLKEADAGLVVEFSKDKAICIKSVNTRVDTIKNKIALEADMLRLYKDNILKKKRAIITEIVYAESATILISASKNAKIELKASASIAPAANIDLGDASLQFSVPFKKELAQEFITQSGLVIFYRAMAVNDGIFSGPRVVSNNGYKGAVKEGPSVSEVDFDFAPIKK